MKNTAIVLLLLASLATPTFAAGTDMHEFASKHAFAQEQATQINPIKEQPIGSSLRATAIRAAVPLASVNGELAEPISSSSAVLSHIDPATAHPQSA